MSSNPASILDSVKKVLGLDSEYTEFDLDVIMFINSAFGTLQQLGVGSDTGFVISDNTTLWNQYVSDQVYLGMIQHFIFMNVRLAFDPPATSFTIEAFQKQIAELTWRINVMAEALNPPSAPNGLPWPYKPPAENLGGGVLTTYFAPKVTTIPFAPFVQPDASRGNVFYLTVYANCTIEAPVNGADGQHITLELIANDFTVTWGSGWNFGTAGLPELSTDGSTDIISAVYNEASAEWRAGYSPGF